MPPTRQVLDPLAVLLLDNRLCKLLSSAKMILKRCVKDKFLETGIPTKLLGLDFQINLKIAVFSTLNKCII